MTASFLVDGAFFLRRIRLNVTLSDNIVVRLLYYFFLMTCLWLSAAPALGQQTPAPTPSPTPESETKKVEQDIEDIFRIRKKRSSVTQTADFGNVGQLEVGYSYSGLYRGPGYRSQHTGTLTVDLAATERIGLDFEFDSVDAQVDSSDVRTIGVGDSRLTAQFDLLDEKKGVPSFAVSYFMKFPAASVIKGLGTGRFDHKFTALVSKKARGVDIDINAALLINGKQGESGYLTGGEYSLAFSRDLTKKFNLLGEIFGETKDSDQPQGLFASGVGSYQIGKKANVNVGLIVGLTQASPRLGLNIGITFNAGNLYK